MKTRQLITIFSLVLLGLLTSCKYDVISPEKVPPIDTIVPVKFTQQIVPIFTTGNNCTSCHKAGATPPDLTAANAYSAIVPSLINTANAASSAIYWHTHPNSTTHSWKKYTMAEAALILVWIQQGAKNN